MVQITRRKFMQGSVVAVAGGIYMPQLFVRALRIAEADGSKPVTAGPDQGNTLIIIQLAGGNDGLNTVVPYQNGTYYSVRPTLAVKQNEVIPLNQELGLAPSLKDLKPIWDAGHLAIVDGVGYNNPNFSHFEAMDIWQTADPLLQKHDGWLSTLVDGYVDRNGHPLGAVGLGSGIPPALCCPPVPPPVVDSPASYKLFSDPRYPKTAGLRESALQQLYASYKAPAPYAALLDSTQTSAAASTAALQSIVTGYQPKVQYPSNSLADGLKLFASLVAGGHGLRIGYVILGGFDTHADQYAHQQSLLQTLSTSVAAFYNDLAAQGKSDDVLVVTWSEFGRRVAENTSQGTDHGSAAPMFVLGGKVKGGMLGEPPDLTNLDDGNLKFAVDFRSVYASVLQEWLEVDSKSLLGQQFPTLPLLG